MEICVEISLYGNYYLYCLPFCHGLCGCGWYIYELREK